MNDVRWAIIERTIALSLSENVNYIDLPQNRVNPGLIISDYINSTIWQAHDYYLLAIDRPERS